MLKSRFLLSLQKRALPRGRLGRIRPAQHSIEATDQQYDTFPDEPISSLQKEKFDRAPFDAEFNSAHHSPPKRNHPGRIDVELKRQRDQVQLETSFTSPYGREADELTGKFDESAFGEDEENQGPLSRIETFEEKQLRRAMSRKLMLKRKEIPRESETLLTWAAMDQIRRLNEMEPKIWTPEQIAKSFPISVEGATRLLRSKPPSDFSPEDIQKHDQIVNQRWRELTKDLNDDSAEKETVSKNTKLMLKMGMTKFIPLKTFSDDQNISKRDEKSLVPSTVTSRIRDQNDPTDGPFMKMYRRHLHWKEATKNLPITLQPKDNKMDQNELLKLILNFDSKKQPENGTKEKEECSNDEIVMQFRQFMRKNKNQNSDADKRSFYNDNDAFEKSFNKDRPPRKRYDFRSSPGDKKAASMDKKIPGQNFRDRKIV